MTDFNKTPHTQRFGGLSISENGRINLSSDFISRHRITSDLGVQLLIEPQYSNEHISLMIRFLDSGNRFATCPLGLVWRKPAFIDVTRLFKTIGSSPSVYAGEYTYMPLPMPMAFTLSLSRKG